MLSFLKRSRQLVNAKEASCIVLGNESCDLDSAISAICLAFFYQEISSKQKRPCGFHNFLPVLNIPHNDYPLKTEVRYLLDKYEIPDNVLTFRDELNDDFLARSKFILVDHHVSPFLYQCIAVFDHRPKDATAIFPKDCMVTLESVGSCTTLVAETILNDIAGRTEFELETLKTPFIFLRDTIILDTINFDTNAMRFTPKDENICCCLENSLRRINVAEESREQIFKTLCKERASVDRLSAAQLLRKDFKILKSPNAGSDGLALPGFPLPVQMFLKMPDAETAIREFAANNFCNIVLLMGMFVNDAGGVERDIGLINISGDNALFNSIENILLESTDPKLGLEKYATCDFMSGSFYKQQNIKATRKHVLPLVKQTFELWKA